MANGVYNRGKYKMGMYNWDTDVVNIGVMLVTNAYAFDDAHNTVADVVANEAAGAGYARAPIAAGARSVNEDDPGNAANLRVTDSTVVWPGLNCGVDLRVVLFIVDGASINDPANSLLSYYDTGTNVPINTNGGQITLNFSSDGALKYA